MKNTRKKITSITCGVLAGITLLSIGACTQEKEIINAYDIAVKNGFVGTEEEWLASLHGANGKDGQDLNIYDLYEAAKKSEAGYEGDLLQFIRDYFGDVSFDLHEDNDTAAIAKNVSSVVSVYCAFRSESICSTKVSGSAGSGIIIDYGFNKEAGTAYILTNYHVIYNGESDAENGISDCIYVYPYGALNNFTDGDKNGDGTLDDMNGDKLKNEDDQGDMSKGQGVRAKFIGGAMDYDIAILKVEGGEYFRENEVTPAVWGDSNQVAVGEKAFAIGNANGQGISVTTGVVSVDSEYIAMGALDGRDMDDDREADEVSYRVMRTDAAINHGNSGGALFNAKGELIGITNAKNVEDETDNMGYALPSTQVRYLVGNILYNVENGIGNYATRAMLGVQTSIESRSTYRDEAGRLVVSEEIALASFSGASTAAKTNGLASRDNILAIGDVFQSITLKDPNDRSKSKTFAIRRQFEINDLLLTVRKGDTVTFKVLREGQEKTVNVAFDKDGFFVKYA